MTLYLLSKTEARELLSDPTRFRGITICDGALPPVFILEAGIAAKSSTWLMPRLFCDDRSQQIVGSGGFKSEPQDGSVEIGYGVAPAFRQRGYATQAVRLLVREAFASDRIDEVVAETVKSNTASSRVLEKAGFSKNGSGTDCEEPVDRWILRSNEIPAVVSLARRQTFGSRGRR